MKKLLYPTLVLSLLIVLGFVYKNYNDKKNAIPTYKERPAAVSATSEWLNAKEAIQSLVDRLRRHPNDIKAKLHLSMAYVQESRATGDHAYYDEAALKLVNQVIEKEPLNYDALCVRTTILLSQHHFTEALKEAEQIVSRFPHSAYGYGLLFDAHIELGNYDKAAIAIDTMMGIRPDLRSYSRVSYLREIHGDMVGAKQAMQYAVEAGVPGLEQTEWCRTQLAQLYEKTNDTASAGQLYRASLTFRPHYAYALSGLARLEKLKGNYSEAIALLEKANETVIDFAFYDEMTDLYRLQNQPDKAIENAQKVIKMLSQHANDETASPDKGHYADLELAYAYLKLGDTENALLHATREWNRRPNNIQTNECLAWVYFNKNDKANAMKYIKEALKTNSKNLILLQRANQISKMS